MDGDSQKIFSFAEFELDAGKRRLLRDGKTLGLNAKAFDVLVFLAENAGRVVSKEELLDAVWRDQFVEEANLAVQISQLRKVLGEQKDNPRFLVTIPGKGYKFIAAVNKTDDETIVEKDAIKPDLTAEPLDKVSAADFEQFSEEISQRKKAVYAYALGAVVLILLAGIFIYKSLVVKPDVPLINSLAVLPFVNQSGNAETEYLSDGLAESVTFSLSGRTDLRVISRNSAFRYKGKETDAKTIGRELNVQAILMGRVVRLGDRIAVSTELISTADNSVIWGEQFTRQMSNIEFLQTDIALAISQKLRLTISGTDATRLAENQPVDAKAYEFYLLGRYHLNKLTDEGFFKGRDYFQQAIDRDPKYALAYTGLADAHNRLSAWNAISPKEGFPKAKEAAIKALEIDDRLAEAHISLAMVKLFYDWDWAVAESEFRKALELNPDNSDAHYMYSLYLMRMGRFDEALVEMRRAHELDPLSLEKFAGIGEIFYYQRQYDQAIEQYKKILELEPNSGFAYWWLGNVYVQKGMFEDAVAAYQKSIPLSGDSPDEPAGLAYAYALSGNKKAALQIIEELKQRSHKSYISPVLFAVVYIGLNEKEQAFEWLEKGFAERDSFLTSLKVEPIFDPLRSDSRYSELIRRIGFSQQN